MKIDKAVNHFTHWRNEQLFDVDFYTNHFQYHSFPRHFHNHYIIQSITAGVDRFYCDGKNYTATADEIVYINPGEVHTGSTVGDSVLRYNCIALDRIAFQKIADVLDRQLPLDFNFERTMANNVVFQNKMLLLFSSFNKVQKNTLYCDQLFFECMGELFLNLFHCNSSRDAKYDPRVNILIQFIRSNFRENISLQQMAETVCLNPFHLIRVFKSSIGMSPYDYLIIVRIEFAKQLLQKGKSVFEAALESGFYDASHFYRIFKKVTSTTPKVYRSSKCQYHTLFY